MPTDGPPGRGDVVKNWIVWPLVAALAYIEAVAAAAVGIALLSVGAPLIVAVALAIGVHLVVEMVPVLPTKRGRRPLSHAGRERADRIADRAGWTRAAIWARESR
ncbi:hypothetical protein ACIQM4_34495 [Streptomyces sp. NPDC091272]|uniref:hypothetical protein n=1 Tax=Streptomyces sp. NPDC091272 TaxID=3365981 RepID=UPI0038150795